MAIAIIGVLAVAVVVWGFQSWSAIRADYALLAAGDEQHTTADLRAQQDMAQWAFAMFVTGVVGTLTTLAGVIYVAMTLNAALAANAAFVEHSTREQRANVGLVSATLAFTEDRTPVLWLVFKNTGKSPAEDFAAKCLCGLVIGTTHRTFASRQHPTQTGFDIDPESESKRKMLADPITEEEAKACYAGGALARVTLSYVYVTIGQRYERTIALHSEGAWHHVDDSRPLLLDHEEK